MAIAYVNSAISANADGTSSTTISSSAGIAVSAGNVLVVGVRSAINPLTSATVITDTAGNTFHFLGNEASTAYWYAYNVIANASDIITATFPSSTTYRELIVGQYSGLDPNPLDATAMGITPSSTTPTTSSFSTIQPNEVIVCVLDVEVGSTTWTAGSGYTIRNQTGDHILMLQDKIVSSIQTGVTASATNSDSANYKMILAATFWDQYPWMGGFEDIAGKNPGGNVQMYHKKTYEIGI